MRSGWRIAAVVLLALSAGCNRRRQNVTLSVTAQAPTRSMSQMAELNPPMPPLPAYEQMRPIGLDTTIPPEPKTPAPTAAHHSRHHPRTTPDSPQQPQQEVAKSTPAAEPPPAPPEVASVQPSENSPIGQISTAGGDTNTADRQSLSEQINGLESGLNSIHRTLDPDEQKTATLIRTFITKARQALKTEDLDGARNYSTKAKLLLQELTKE